MTKSFHINTDDSSLAHSYIHLLNLLITHVKFVLITISKNILYLWVRKRNICFKGYCKSQNEVTERSRNPKTSVTRKTKKRKKIFGKTEKHKM